MALPHSPVKLTFLDSLVGLLLYPSESTEDLFADYPPPFAFTFLLLFVLVLFSPVLSVLLTFDFADTLAVRTSILALFVFVAFLSFLLFEAMLLTLLGIQFSMSALLCGVAYSSAPVSFGLLLIHIFNYLAIGSFSVANYMAIGVKTVEDSFFPILPYAFLIIGSYSALLFLYVLRALGNLNLLFGIVAIILSTIPLMGALGFSLFITDIFHPGSILTIEKLFRGLLWPST